MGLFKRIIGGQKADAPTLPDGKAAVEPRHVDAEEFEALVKDSELPVVVDFWAEWCGPCHAIAPAVAALATEYDGRAIVAKVNADDHPDLLGRLGIMGIPTVIFFRGGEELDRQVGMTGYGALKNKLERVLA